MLSNSIYQYIYNLSVSKKLMLFALVPALTIAFFAFDSISNKIELRDQRKVTYDFVLTSATLVNIVSALQNERALASAHSDVKPIENLSVDLTDQQRQTDEAIAKYLGFIKTIESTPKDWFREKEFERFQKGLDGLATIREYKKGAHPFRLYSELIRSILSIVESLQTQSVDILLVSKLSVYSMWISLEELMAQERAIINNIFINGKINAEQSYVIHSLINKQKQLQSHFNSIAPKSLIERVNQQLRSPLYGEIEALKQTLLNRSERSEYLNRLQAFFGYGGMIHSFKNYLLRSNQRYLNVFNFDSKESLNVIQSMRQLKGISISELSALKAIEDTTLRYMENMELMLQLKKDQVHIEKIDAQVATNDFLALNALKSLLEGKINVDASIWWSKTRSYDEFFKSVSIELRDSIISLSEQKVEESENQVVEIIAITVLSALVIILLGVIILRRLVSDVVKISDGMNRMVTTGNYGSRLSIEGKDEIAVMANSFNALLSNVEVSQRQLIGQKLAMDEHSIVATTDLKGTITHVNQKFCDISGYSEEELIGQNHRILNSGNQTKDYWREMFLVITKGKVWHDEVMNISKDGQCYWVDTTIVPITWDTDSGENNSNTTSGRRNKGYIAIRTDISNRKRQEENLLDAKIAAEAASVAKSQFLATMSHEIRTPMNGVIGMAQLLEDTPLNDEQKDYLDTITRSGTSLLSIINDILDFSKLDAEMVEIENIPFDLERVCQDCLVLVAGNSAEKKLEFIFDYAPDCPRHFKGDALRIRQILINLLGNSVKFTKSGFVRLGISSVKIDDVRTSLKIEVQDTGIGLKSDAINSLFDEFTQADNSTTREYGGTGLGLAITKKLATLMHCELKVESVFGEGSTFSIAGDFEISVEPETRAEQPLKGIRLLFVDENEKNRVVFKRVFEHMGAETTVEKDPLVVEKILEKASKQGESYQILVLDNKMSALDGLELAHKVRANTDLSELKLLLFSSLGRKGDVALFAQAGFDACLNKLSRYDTLKAVLSAMLLRREDQPIITQYSVKNSQPSSQDSQTLFNAKVLVVEDVLPNLIIAQKFLRKMGVQVDVARNGQEAVNAVNQQSYDLVFMDCRMPVMDGYEATQLIRQQEKSEGRNKHLPIVALTANASNEDQLLCQQAGMDDMVTKPFKRSDLSDSLKKWLKVTEKTIEVMPAQQENKSEAMIVDQAVLQQLREDMGEDFEEIQAAIFDSIQSNLVLLEQRGADTEAKEVIRFVHSIKSPAANLGMMYLSQLAEQLEVNLRAKDEADLDQAIKRMGASFEAAKQALL